MTIDYTPLTDLGSAEYLGSGGGLYPGGKNSRPPAYEEAGVAAASAVRPLDKNGDPSDAGKIGLLCVGMSNASHEFLEFTRLTEADARTNPSLLMIDGAQEGAAAPLIAVARGEYWKHVDSQLARRDASTAQVQVVWLKAALAHDSRGFPGNARALQRALRAIMKILGTKFPQLKLVYLSSRTYGGYSTSDLSPEPIAYESGFAVKWLIEERINNASLERSVPWVAWGPYLWANGMTPRTDGVSWERSDFEPDGVHPSVEGSVKVAAMVLEFFQKDPTAKPWFFKPWAKSN